MLTGKATLASVVILSFLAVGACLCARPPLPARHTEAAQPAPPQLPARDRGERQADEKEQDRLDLHGDPLPSGAVARLGTVRLRREPLSAGCLTFLPDGKTLVSARTAKVVQPWDAKTGKPLHELRQEARFSVFALSPSGKILATAGRDTITVWDVLNRKQLRKIAVERDRHDEAIAIAPDGRSLAFAGKDKSVRLCDVGTGKETRLFTGHTETVHSLLFTPDGKMLLSGDYRSIRVWDVGTGQEVRKIGSEAVDRYVSCMALSSDGTILVSGGTGLVANSSRASVLWDVATGKKLRELQGHKYAAASVAFSRDGKTLASSEYEMIRLWDVATGRELRRIGRAGRRHYGLAFSTDGKTLASATLGTDSVIRLWDVTTGKALQPAGHEGRAAAVAFSPDGKLVATGGSPGYDFSIRLWDGSTGQLLKTFEGHQSYIQKVLFTPDGKGIISASSDGTLRLWDIQTCKANRTYAIHEFSEYDALGMALSPDGKRFTSINYDPGDTRPRTLVIVWDVQTGKRLLQRESNDLFFSYPLPFSADGEVTAEATDKGLTLREAGTGQEFRRLELSNLRLGEKLLGLVAFSPDGRAAAAVTHAPIPGERLHELADCTIHLWELATGRAIRRIPGIKNALTAVAFSPDGRTLAVGGEGLLQLWDLATGQELLSYRGQDAHVSLGTLAFSPDGTRLAAGYQDSTSIVWDLTPGIRRARMAPKPLTPASLQRLWMDLAADDPANAHAALWTLVATPREALPLLKERLKPDEPIAPQHIRRLLTGLDSPRFAVRAAAERELEQIADQAEPLLREALKQKPTLEARRRIEGILLAARAVRTLEGLRRLRAIQVLEQIGTTEARRILEELAKGAPAARGTKDAKVALQWLARRASVTIP